MGADEPGEEPDPRFTFANERTFLAWTRTALALVATGLAVVQFLDLHWRVAPLLIAVPMMVLGAAVAVISLRRLDERQRAMRLKQPLPDSRLPAIVAIGVGSVAVVAGVLAIVDVATR